MARSLDALARPASNNMPLSEQDTQELQRLMYLKAEGIERQERLQYLRQTWKSRKVYSVFGTVFFLLLMLVVAVGCPAACFG